MAVPNAIPLITPVPVTEAMLALLLLHTPLPDTSLNNAVAPTQTFILPEIAAGAKLIVTLADALQPIANV
jgi:hypothetical protein